MNGGSTGPERQVDNAGSNGNTYSGRILTFLIWLWGGGLAATALAVAVLGATHWLYWFWGNQAGGGDQLNYAVYLAHGENYFTRPDTYPMLTPDMPGLFSLLLVPWVYAFGPKLLYGNILGALSLAVTLAATAIAARTCSKRTISIPLAWGLLLSMRRIGDGYAYNRPDSLAGALVAVSLVCLLRNEAKWAAARSNSIYLTVGAVTAVLAIFSKQTALAMIAGTCVYFVMTKAVRELIRYIGASLLLGIPIVLIAQRLTGGGYLYNLVTIVGAMPEYSLAHWLRTNGLFILGNIGTLFLAGVGAYGLIRRGIRRDPLSSLTVVTCVLTIFVVGTCWHEGAGLNHFLFALFGLAVTGGIAAADWFSNPSRSQRAVYTCFLLLTVGQVALNHLTPWRALKEMWPAPWSLGRPDLRKAERLFERTRRLEGEVLFDRLSGMAVLQGRRVEVEPASLAILKERKVWNPKVFLADLNRRRWRYIVATSLYSDSPLVFFGDAELDAAFKHGYQCSEEFPLDIAPHVAPSAHLCRARSD
jgi:hypothetical protein